MMNELIIITVMISVITLGSFLLESRRLLNGLLFNITVFTWLITLFAIFASDSSKGIFLVILFIPILFLLIFGIYGLIIFLFVNSHTLLKREGKSFANYLTFLVAIGLSLFVVYISWISKASIPGWVQSLLSIIPLCIFYFSCAFLNYLSASFLYRFQKIKHTPDYIIVLGSGLIHGDQVPPLLQNRIRKGYEYYQIFKEKNPQIKMIFSGGQGSNETISEAEAMYHFACGIGLPAEDGILEKESKNTYQNLLYSKSIIEQAKNTTASILFVTSQYHVFRAALYSKRLDLQAVGKGAYTTFYYVPNALLREFAAVLVMNKRRHLLWLISFVIIIILLTILNFKIR